MNYQLQVSAFYIILMQNIPLSSSKNLRLERMNSLRSSMKQITLLSKKSIEIENKYASKKENSNLLENLTNTDDTSSSNSANSAKLLSPPLNSFLQKYDLLQKIGEGANACVYKCKHKESGRLFATKKFRFQQQHILELKRNFINLKELRHSSIIRYKALYLDLQQHCAYLVMECFDKPSLADINFTTEEEVKLVAKELVKAIQYLHNRNICHRDIKPENILYCRKTKRVKIIDFGISKKTFQRGSRRDMLTVIGTHFYQAPQVYIGGGYDQRIDLWALGITIFKMLTGTTPFESEYHCSTIQNIIKCEPSFDGLAWSKYSNFAKDFVCRLLKKKEERMSLKEAMKHMWLSQSKRLQRSKSQTFQLHEEFHDQMNNKIANALSREQSTKQVKKLISKKIQLINLTQFDLTDTESQDDLESTKLLRPLSYEQAEITLWNQ